MWLWRNIPQPNSQKPIGKGRKFPRCEWLWFQAEPCVRRNLPRQASLWSPGMHAIEVSVWTHWPLLADLCRSRGAVVGQKGLWCVYGFIQDPT